MTNPNPNPNPYTCVCLCAGLPGQRLHVEPEQPRGLSFLWLRLHPAAVPPARPHRHRWAPHAAPPAGARSRVLAPAPPPRIEYCVLRGQRRCTQLLISALLTRGRFPARCAPAEGKIAAFLEERLNVGVNFVLSAESERARGAAARAASGGLLPLLLLLSRIPAAARVASQSALTCVLLPRPRRPVQSTTLARTTR